MYLIYITIAYNAREICNTMLLSTRLREIRKKMGKTQDEMAIIVGASKRAYSGYETGENEPSVKMLQGFALAGIDLHYLLTGENSPSPHQTAQIDAKQHSPPNEISPDLLAQARLEGKVEAMEAELRWCRSHIEDLNQQLFQLRHPTTVQPPVRVSAP